MTDLDRLTTWMDGYVRAWQSNDPADIAALFAERASARAMTCWRAAASRARWQAGIGEVVQAVDGRLAP
jgi:hypothetical protein